MTELSGSLGDPDIVVGTLPDAELLMKRVAREMQTVGGGVVVGLGASRNFTQKYDDVEFRSVLGDPTDSENIAAAVVRSCY
ncbi:hypothetical protein [Rhodococcoides yunnanense]|uniref:hypothetical protein n=1 Tax=Rhodococcoides yunnanense TaxID=278209 RepID=UPI0009349B18|nr:hypothetical protein [Rhodococcus yunnanensis]